jgi:hypothetical protein
MWHTPWERGEASAAGSVSMLCWQLWWQAAAHHLTGQAGAVLGSSSAGGRVVALPQVEVSQQGGMEQHLCGTHTCPGGQGESRGWGKTPASALTNTQPTWCKPKMACPSGGQVTLRVQDGAASILPCMSINMGHKHLRLLCTRAYAGRTPGAPLHQPLPYPPPPPPAARSS